MNASFKAALRDLTTDALARVIVGPIPLRSWTRLVRESEQSSRLDSQTRQDLDRIAIDGARGLDQSPALDELLAAVVAEPALAERLFRNPDGQPVEQNAWRHLIYMWIALPFWQAYVTRTAARIFTSGTMPPFDLGAFEDVFGCLASDLVDPMTSRGVRFTPLTNLRIVGGTVEVAPDVRLREISSDMIEAWYNGMLNQPFWLMVMMQLKCGVEVTTRVPRGQLGSPQAEEVTRNVVGLLRLLTDHRVVPAFSEDWIEGVAFGFGRAFTHPPSFLPVAPPAIVDAAMGERLRRLWDLAATSPNSQKVALAFRRFAGADDRPNEEDRLIDYWVGLESLFTPDSTQELRFRAALRIGAMLGTTPDERVRLYGAMRKSYDVRSAIVHGSNYSACELVDASREARSALRMALLQLLEAEHSFDAQQTDVAILRGGTEGDKPLPTS